jgi:DNA-binding response OmpR family regulator
VYNGFWWQLLPAEFPRVERHTVAERKEQVLVISQDADEQEMIVEAALKPFGYAVQAVSDGGEALARVQEEPPDIVILDLHLQGLSGQDVMAALNAQSFQNPVILLANEGAEKEALQVFRLGAEDYVVRPFREAELIQVVERALESVRLRHDRENLVSEVQSANLGTRRHLAELRTLMGIGKSITQLRKLNEVFDEVIQAAIDLTSAEAAGFFLRDDQTNALILRAGRNLAPDLARKMGQPVEDDLAALVMTSRETYLASGEGLQRFSPAQVGANSVIYSPLVVSDSSIGLLWVANQEKAFENHMKDLMTALADYAAIAVVNTRLFASMQEQTRLAEQAAEAVASEAINAASGPDPRYEDFVAEVRKPLTEILANMNMFRTGEMGRLATTHQAAVDVMHRQLEQIIEKIDAVAPPDTGGL